MSQYTIHSDKDLRSTFKNVSKKYNLPIASLLRALMRKLEREPFDRQLHTDASQDFVEKARRKYTARQAKR